MISGFDHVSLPMRDADAMAAFYRALGATVDETEHVVVVHLGDQMINFHRAEMWTARRLHPPRARGGTPRAATSASGGTDRPTSSTRCCGGAGIAVEEGPVPRRGARGVEATSVYVRDPDGNLVEFMRYP